MANLSDISVFSTAIEFVKGLDEDHEGNWTKGLQACGCYNPLIFEKDVSLKDVSTNDDKRVMYIIANLFRLAADDVGVHNIKISGISGNKKNVVPPEPVIGIAVGNDDPECDEVPYFPTHEICERIKHIKNEIFAGIERGTLNQWELYASSKFKFPCYKWEARNERDEELHKILEAILHFREDEPIIQIKDNVLTVSKKHLESAAAKEVSPSLSRRT